MLRRVARRRLARRIRAPTASVSFASTTSKTAHDALRIGIVGLGSIGTIFFARLVQAAQERATSVDVHVTGFVKSHHIAQLQQQQQIVLCQPNANGDADVSAPLTTIGLTNAKHVEDQLRGDCFTIRSLETSIAPGLSANEPLDAVFVTVKAYDTPSVLQKLKSLPSVLAKDAVIVLLQNGLGDVPSNSGASGTDARQWSYSNGVTFVGGKVVAPGRVLVSGLDKGQTFISLPALVPGGTRERLVQAMAATGLHFDVVDAATMQAILWKKLIVNAAINPIASLLDATNQSVAATKWSRQCVQAIVREAHAVAASESVDLGLTQQEMVDAVLRVATATGTNVCSMLADLRKGSRTEISAISGKIVEYGKKHGIATPTNEFVLAMIKAREASLSGREQ
ncbi:TPA: hypothetical protein N0F65_010734 [Lagenidium giganteum]|uniref:2-dehydropantoate 2-reductase n=1 Tax=Lagenidium giganteum TaxID=4803 RepID=A0AAV2YMY9_9STRA|nr:TPA: hypothetical protein N0F65_010734 [Lagenidium giganteum]